MRLAQIVLKKDHKEFIKNKLILKIQQRFKSERRTVFTEEINKIALSSNDAIKECNQMIWYKNIRIENAKI